MKIIFLRKQPNGKHKYGGCFEISHLESVPDGIDVKEDNRSWGESVDSMKFILHLGQVILMILRHEKV